MKRYINERKINNYYTSTILFFSRKNLCIYRYTKWIFFLLFGAAVVFFFFVIYWNFYGLRSGISIMIIIKCFIRRLACSSSFLSDTLKNRTISKSISRVCQIQFFLFVFCALAWYCCFVGSIFVRFDFLELFNCHFWVVVGRRDFSLMVSSDENDLIAWWLSLIPFWTLQWKPTSNDNKNLLNAPIKFTIGIRFLTYIF